MKKESVTYKNDEKSSEGNMYFNGYLNNIIDLKIRNSLLVYTFINGAVKFFNLSSIKELLDGINAGNISILSKPDLKIGKDIIRLPHVAFVYRTILEATSDSGIILKHLSDNKHIIYETSLLSDELKITGLFDNIAYIIRNTIGKMAEDEKNTKLMNQFITAIKSALTTNQISVNEFKDAFIAGKAKLVTLNTSGNFVTLNTFAPFLFINYNGENYNTNISLETITELFEEGVDLEDLNNMIMSWF